MYSSEWIDIFKDKHFWPLYIRTQTIFGKCMRAPSEEVRKLSELYQEGKEKLDKDLLLDGILQKIKKTWRVVVNEYNVREFKSPSVKEKRSIMTLKTLYSEDSSKKPPPLRNMHSLTSSRPHQNIKLNNPRPSLSPEILQSQDTILEPSTPTLQVQVALSEKAWLKTHQGTRRRRTAMVTTQKRQAKVNEQE